MYDPIKNRNIEGVATANIVLLVAEKVALGQAASARARQGAILPLFGVRWNREVFGMLEGAASISSCASWESPAYIPRAI